ncbi:hypothetical protein [Lysinibacillus sp. ZYM-1]|uniref:hypothetical protein n=1 Tax=Lysinibacillus sp. ZYM-1 TaxID=1681184 RepID=UPI000B196C01|nr:hypothetical protein [Lysinibacillus sp. ZYM-1]
MPSISGVTEMRLSGKPFVLTNWRASSLAMHADPIGFYHQYEPRVYYIAKIEGVIG